MRLFSFLALTVSMFPLFPAVAQIVDGNGVDWSQEMLVVADSWKQSAIAPVTPSTDAEFLDAELRRELHANLAAGGPPQ